MPPATTPKKPPSSSKIVKPRGYKPSLQKIEHTDDDLEEWKKSRQLAKPPNQLQLTDAELKEEIPRLLCTSNMQQPDSIVEYSYAEGEWIRLPLPGNTITLITVKGTLIHKASDEAKRQLGGDVAPPEEEEEEEEGEGAEAKPEGAAKPEGEEGEDEDEDEDEEEGEAKPEEGEGEAEEEGAAPSGKPKKLTNQFNFCERAAQTYNNPTRQQETETIPPPRANLTGQVLQWLIYDAYAEDYAVQQKEKEKERTRPDKPQLPPTKKELKKRKEAEAQALQMKIYDCWRTLERMVNQNIFDDIAQDFRYWDDPADEYREEEGTLLPLWKFQYEKTRRNMVTDLFWNPWYYDMYGACFGTLEFTKPMKTGALCLFTLKNPSFPEFICMTTTSVMCVDIHPKYPYLMAVGLYDGNIFIYNIQGSKTPQFKTDSVENKHTGIVWQVRWAADMPDGEINFFSVGADGKVNHWILMHMELSVTTILVLYLEMDALPGPDGTSIKPVGSASCVTFHPKDPSVYLVGTEEGFIYKCSTEYSSRFLLTYTAHSMPIYRIDYNKFIDSIFVSCSSDWRIKIWEDNRLEPLFVYDMGSPVGDVKWAPYSSTVFAAVTSDGRVHVFDLNVNKYKPICVQPIVSKRRNKLTRIDFNYKLPILIVGDDKGCVSCLKLSPNLRVMCKPPKKMMHLDQFTLQCMKLDKLLALVREPQELEYPPDLEKSEST